MEQRREKLGNRRGENNRKWTQKVVVKEKENDTTKLDEQGVSEIQEVRSRRKINSVEKKNFEGN